MVLKLDPFHPPLFRSTTAGDMATWEYNTSTDDSCSRWFYYLYSERIYDYVRIVTGCPQTDINAFRLTPPVLSLVGRGLSSSRWHRLSIHPTTGTLICYSMLLLAMMMMMITIGLRLLTSLSSLLKPPQKHGVNGE